MSEWKPIESAPKDGTLILGFGEPIGEINGRFKEAAPVVMAWLHGWTVYSTDAYSVAVDATHWMPLPPDPPAVTISRGGPRRIGEG